MVDPAIRQTRFAWLRALPEAPSGRNLLGLIERLIFVRSFGLDPQRRARIHPDRWTQLVREGAVTPSWLADDFNAGRRQALIAAQLIELTSKLTDAHHHQVLPADCPPVHQIQGPTGPAASRRP